MDKEHTVPESLPKNAGAAMVDQQHIEELRAELNDSLDPREQKIIKGELDRAQGSQATADLLHYFGEHRAELEARDPNLAERITRLSDTFRERPLESFQDAHFKTDLGYALQDAEKLQGVIAVDKSLRSELDQLAASNPGLKNEQMQKLLQMTPTIDDTELVARLRDKAAEIAGKANQTTKAIQNDIHALSFEVLSAPRREPVAAASSTYAVSPPSPRAGAEQAAANPPRPITDAKAEIEAFDAPAASKPASSDPETRFPSSFSDAAQSENFAGGPDRSATAPDKKPAPEERADDQKAPTRPDAQTQMNAFGASSGSASTQTPIVSKSPAADIRAQASAPPARPPANDDRKLDASASRPASPPASAALPKSPNPDDEDANSTQTHEIQVVQQRLVLGGVFGKAVGALGRSASALGRVLEAATPESAQSSPQTAPQQVASQSNRADVRQRLQQFEKTRMQPKRDDSQLLAADGSARAALDALNAFRQTPGASILNRIQDAAANNKGGMQAVIAGMKSGGLFEYLRKEFDVALGENQTLAAAYDRAASALGQYGKDREAVTTALASHPNASRWAEHFKKLDADVGEAASAVPGKAPGASMIEELGEKVREIVEKALEKVRGLFHSNPESRPSPSPGP